MEALEYHNETLGVRSAWLIEEGVVTEANYKQLLARGRIRLLRRGGNGRAALAEYSSIPEKYVKAIAERLGFDPLAPKTDGDLETSPAALAWYVEYRTGNGEPLPADRAEEYAARASFLDNMRRAWERRLAARAKCGKPAAKAEFMDAMLEKYAMYAELRNMSAPGNARSLEKIFVRYVAEGYPALIHKNYCNDHARLVSDRAEKLLLAIWSERNYRAFADEVHARYMEFARGTTDIYDRTTGEVFSPAEFRYAPKGGGEPRTLEISVSTVRSYLGKHLNDAAVSAAVDGNYIYTVEKRPHHFRRPPSFSMSKISMDDADLSRKTTGGTRVHRYMAFDVASGYWFAPVYSRTALTVADVMQCFRNMFCELELMNLPMPGEIEHEHHLMDSVMTEEFRRLFPFTTVTSHSRSKRAEHAIKSLKWGVAHETGHTRGRFYGKGAYRSPRFRQKGDWVEKELEYDTVVRDDIADIEAHNAAPHPLRKTYPGMSRRDVFVKNFNPDLKRLEPRYLYRYIGNETKTAIRNNSHMTVNGTVYLLDDFDALDRMELNDAEVTAYWLPAADGGAAEKVYVYQGDRYAGSATTAENFRYNESRFEATEEDDRRRLEQDKRIAKFDKKVKEIRREIPKIGRMKHTAEYAEMEAVEVPAPQRAQQPAPQFDFDAAFMTERAMDY